MRRLKALLALLLVATILVVVAQNTETVDTRVLFATISMPRAVLLAVTTGSGVVVGLLACAWLRGGRRPGE